MKNDNFQFHSIFFRWAETKCNKKHLDYNNFSKISSVIGDDICYLIRFPSLKPEFFRSHVLPMGLLRRPDYELLEYYWKLLEKDS